MVPHEHWQHQHHIWPFQIHHSFMTLVLWLPHIGKDISASPTIENVYKWFLQRFSYTAVAKRSCPLHVLLLCYSIFAFFLDPSFDQRLSQANLIFFIFSSETLFGYVKHTKLHCFLQRHIPRLNWKSHAIVTVIDI